MQFVKPTEIHEAAYLGYLAEWERNGESLVPDSGMLKGRDYAGWLSRKRKAETAPDEGLVPSTQYFLVEDGEILGTLDFRHRLNDYLLAYHGHIGYGVRPSQRRKGYAKEMLMRALGIAGNMGLDRVMVSCNKKNTASAATIRACGGVMENEVELDGETLCRFWIDVK